MASPWDRIANAVGASRAKLGIAVPDDVHLPGVEAELVVRALHLELGKAKPVGVVTLLQSLIEIEGTALDVLGEFLAQQWLASDRDASLRWLLDAAGSVGGPRTASLLGAFLEQRLFDNTAHHLVTAVAAALWRMQPLAGAHEILMLAELPSRFTKRRAGARALFAEIAKRSKLSPQQLALRCAPREADDAWRERIEDVWARRCERIMVDGVRLPYGELRAYAIEHPVRAPLMAALVLVTSDRDKRALAAFHATASGPCDASGAAMTIADDTLVGIAHPVELRALGQLDAWAALSGDQPFRQLDRTIRELTARQASLNVLRDFRTIQRDALFEHGWEPTTSDDDMTRADVFTIRMARDGLYLECRLVGDVVGGVAIRRGTEAVTFGSLSPVSQSELLYAFLGQGEPPVSHYPYAEQAKTNRSTCVQCEKRIAKDAIRVVVEHPDQVPHANATAVGYLHAACVAAYPPLAALPDRDARIAAGSRIPWPPT